MINEVGDESEINITRNRFTAIKLLYDILNVQLMTVAIASR